MTTEESILQVLRGELGKDPRIAASLSATSLRYDDGVLYMEGEVATVAAKCLALERAGNLCCVLGIVDRLHVVPAIRMKDCDLAGLLGSALAQEDAFALYEIVGVTGNDRLPNRRPIAQPRGTIDFAVADGVVTLHGEVICLDHKRLAGVLAWWMPGSRDVINALAVQMPDEDSDENLAEDLRSILKRDPVLISSDIQVTAREGVIFLAGSVSCQADRDRAENDAWCVLGNEGVVNALVVGDPPAEPINLGYRAPARLSSGSGFAVRDCGAEFEATAKENNMSLTGLPTFDETVQLTNSWLKDIMERLDTDDRQYAYLALRATLHAVRDRLPRESAVHLAAQLPMLVRGFYFDGWKFAATPTTERQKDEFLAHVGEAFQRDPKADPEAMARSVFAVLAQRLTEGEVRKIVHLLPSEIRDLWPSPCGTAW